MRIEGLANKEARAPLSIPPSDFVPAPPSLPAACWFEARVPQPAGVPPPSNRGSQVPPGTWRKHTRASVSRGSCTQLYRRSR